MQARCSLDLVARNAGVAELADALDSKSSDRKIVWVRAPPPARFFKRWNLSVQRWTFAGVSSSVCRQKKSRDASTSLGIDNIRKIEWVRASPPAIVGV